MYSLLLVGKKSRYKLIYPLQNLTYFLNLNNFSLTLTVVARLSVLILTTKFLVGMSKLFC